MAQRILVVDDEPDIRHLVALILKTAKYDIVQCASGQQALETLEHSTFDLVILDIMMPDIDGWEVCRQIKSDPRMKETSVLFLTVRNQPLDRVIGLEVIHASGYLTKPFDRDDLLAVVKRILQEASQPSVSQ